MDGNSGRENLRLQLTPLNTTQKFYLLLGHWGFPKGGGPSARANPLLFAPAKAACRAEERNFLLCACWQGTMRRELHVERSWGKEGLKEGCPLLRDE